MIDIYPNSNFYHEILMNFENMNSNHGTRYSRFQHRYAGFNRRISHALLHPPYPKPTAPDEDFALRVLSVTVAVMGRRLGGRR